LQIATTLRARISGLLRCPKLADGETLLLVPCRSIHSFGLSRPIDVAFIDAGGKVLKSITGLPPRRLASSRKACATLERFSNDDQEWYPEGSTLELTIAKNQKRRS